MVHPDNTFEMSIDYKIVNHGSLLDDFNPPVNPPAEIDDPQDRKPENWDEREKIPGEGFFYLQNAGHRTVRVVVIVVEDQFGTLASFSTMLYFDFINFTPGWDPKHPS